MPAASSFFVLSFISSTFTSNNLFPKRISTWSSTFKSVELLAKIPFTLILPLSATSFATVRRLIIRDTFKYLSNHIFITSNYYCTIFIPFIEEKRQRELASFDSFISSKLSPKIISPSKIS